MGFADEMAGFDDQWTEDQAQARKGGILGDGSYTTLITESRIEEKSGVYSWMLKFECQEGSIRKWDNFDSEIGRSIAAQDAKLLGYEGKLSGLEQACESELFIGSLVKIRVKTTPGQDRDFTNVYVNEFLGKGDLPPVDPAMATVPDDDIPF